MGSTYSVVLTGGEHNNLLIIKFMLKAVDIC